MRDSRIVRGQHSEEKDELARQARREPTPTEDRLWAFLRAGRLGGLHFRRQQVVFGFIADFYCHGSKLIVEVDGGVHNDQQQYDGERTEILTTHGFRVLRVTATEVETDINLVLKRIKQATKDDQQEPDGDSQ